MTPAIIVTIVIFILGIIFGIIGFFLKRTISRVDAQDEAIQEIRQTYAKREELCRVEDASEQAYAKLEQRIEERFDRTDSEIKGIKAEYLVREDFFREIAKLGGQLQKVYDLLIERSK